MTPPAVLTQEEIAEGEHLLFCGQGGPYAVCDWMTRGQMPERIFATIRALQERVAKIEASKQQLIAEHRKEIRELEREARDDARASSVEARWQERQGDDYGSY